MSKSWITVVIASVLCLTGVASFVAAMPGSCSPGTPADRSDPTNTGSNYDDTCFGHPRAFDIIKLAAQNPADYVGPSATGAYAPATQGPPIYYGAGGQFNTGACPVTNTVSPTCIPFSPPTFGSVGSPFGGTPPPTGNFRQPNPCRAASEADLYPGTPTPTDPTPLKPSWSPIESIRNLHAAAGVDFVAANSIANTPFDNNEFSSPLGAKGTGRYHLDNQALVNPVQSGPAGGVTNFQANGDPHFAEGAPDDGFVLLGHDGYMLGKFQSSVKDLPGPDIQFNMVQAAYGTFCLYGATGPNGPFTLVHSAFVTSGQPNFQFDLKYFYTPLRAVEAPAADPRNPTSAEIDAWGTLDYFLVVNSVSHTPYLRTDFTVQLPPPPAGMAAWNPMGLAPLRNQDITFKDTSERLGYPTYFVYSPGIGGAGSGQVSPNPGDAHPDPIAAWDWSFPDDPYTLAPGIGVPADRLAIQNTKDAVHKFMAPGTYTVCHSTHTTDQPVYDDSDPPVLQVTVTRQSDPPLSNFYPNANPPELGPSPVTMFCKQVTVYNLAPSLDFTSNQQDPDLYPVRTFDFTGTAVDHDWLVPLGSQTCNPTPCSAACTPTPCTPACTSLRCPDVCGATSCTPVCSTKACPTGCGPTICPTDGIQSRCWYFDTDAVTNLPAAPTINDARGAGPWQSCWTFTGTAFNPAVDNPTHTFARDGLYRVTFQTCDHNGRDVNPVPMPLAVVPPISPDPNWIGDALGAAHGCTQISHNVRVYTAPNQPPVLPAQLNWFGVAGNPVSFTLVGYDVDGRQTLSLRLCQPNPSQPEGSTFLPIDQSTSVSKVIEQEFKWNTRGIQPGTYGPVCFQLSDGDVTTKGYAFITLLEPTADSDQDGVPDNVDNCPAIANPKQADQDKNGAGDECDTTTVIKDAEDQTKLPAAAPSKVDDIDTDGIADLQDDCPGRSNPDQLDLDQDGIGDACDLDSDGDGIGNVDDNCATIYNPDQKDSVHDKIGDACRTQNSATGTATNLAGLPTNSTTPSTTPEGALSVATVAKVGGGGALALLLAVVLILLVIRRWK